MRKPENRWQSYSIGVAAIIFFVVLLLIRLDVPGKFFKSEQKPDIANSNAFIGENWMEITQNGRKIGYAHRKLSRKEKGLQFSEDIFMRINTMGVVQPVELRTAAALKPEGEIVNFQFALSSNLFQFTAEGTLEDGKMVIRMGKDKIMKVLPISDPPYLGAGVLEAAVAGSMKPGEGKTFSVFDPATLSQRPVTITMIGDDGLRVMGKEMQAKKLSVDFNGMKQIAWVSPEGLVLREEGILGIALQTVSRKDALLGLDGAISNDLTMAAAIPSSIPIQDVSTLKTLKIRLNNLPAGHFLLAGGRQRFHDGLLTITSEKFLKKASLSRNDSVNISEFLKSTPFIQADNPKIKKKVFEIVSPDDGDQAKAGKLVAWVYKNVEKRPVLSVPDALETLENMAGDCNEHAVLLAALARAAGLPAEIETGLVYMRGKFFFHAWNVLYIKSLGDWITADASLGQIPADVTHLRFARGSLESQADLAGLIGRLTLDVVGMEK